MFDSPTQHRSGIMRCVNYSIHQVTDRIARSLRYRGRVVDLGCGNAPYKELILEQADEYIGIDWPNSLQDTRRVDVFADLREPIPLDDESADVVVAFQVMEHLPEPKRFLGECLRILRRGGDLYLAVPFMWHVHEAPHDYYRYTRHGLEYLLHTAGFRQIDIREYTGFWQMWILKFNYHTMRFARGPLKYLFPVIWVIGQFLAVRLDRLDPHPQEATGYVVTAIRPKADEASPARAA